jgi:hypothetical protein
MARDPKHNAHIKGVLHGRSAALNNDYNGRYSAPSERESLAIPAWVRAGLAIAQSLQPDRDAQTDLADWFTGGTTINFPSGHADRISGSSLKHLN